MGGGEMMVCGGEVMGSGDDDVLVLILLQFVMML